MQNERFLNLLKTKINKPMSPTLNLLALAVFQLLPLSVSATAATPTKDTRPNIIFILCDDLGYGDLAVNGASLCKVSQYRSLGRRGTHHSKCLHECRLVRAESLRADEWSLSGALFPKVAEDGRCSAQPLPYIKKCRLYDGSFWKMAHERQWS